MNETKELLESWKQDGLVNPDALEKAYQAILALETRVSELEAQVEALSN